MTAFSVAGARFEPTERTARPSEPHTTHLIWDAPDLMAMMCGVGSGSPAPAHTRISESRAWKSSVRRLFAVYRADFRLPMPPNTGFGRTLIWLARNPGPLIADRVCPHDTLSANAVFDLGVTSLCQGAMEVSPPVLRSENAQSRTTWVCQRNSRLGPTMRKQVGWFPGLLLLRVFFWLAAQEPKYRARWQLPGLALRITYLPGALLPRSDEEEPGLGLDLDG